MNVVQTSQIARYSAKNVTTERVSGPWWPSVCSRCASWLTATTTTRAKNSSSHVAWRSVGSRGSVMECKVRSPAMTSMWGGPVADRVRGWRRSRRDPDQARFLTLDSLRWVIRNRAWSPWYLVRYWRLLKVPIANPHIVLRGMVFLGKDLDVHCRPGYGRMEIGRWVHIGEGNAIRCHEGSLRIGDKAVFGRQNVVNCYLDIELGDAALVADWVYICDFDHVTSDIHLPIKDQGIVKSPVRIGPDTWLCTKVTVTKGTRIGRGAVIGAHAVVKGDVPDFAGGGGHHRAAGGRPR